jgi:hypothetical protein
MVDWGGVARIDGLLGGFFHPGFSLKCHLGLVTAVAAAVVVMLAVVLYQCIVVVALYQGLVYAIHSVTKFGTRLGQPATQWDNHMFGPINEVVGNQNPTTVELPIDAFNRLNGENLFRVAQPQRMVAMYGADPAFRFRGRRLFEHDVSCDIYYGVERQLTGPGNNPGIRGVTALRHWSPEEEEEHSDGPRLMGCREMQREIDGSRLTIPTN